MLNFFENSIPWLIAILSLIVTINDSRKKYENYFFIDIYKYKTYSEIGHIYHNSPLLGWNSLEDWERYSESKGEVPIWMRPNIPLLYDDNDLPLIYIRNIGESIATNVSITVRFDSIVNLNIDEERDMIKKSDDMTLFKYRSSDRSVSFEIPNSSRQLYYYESIPKDFVIPIDIPEQFIIQLNLYKIGVISRPPILNIEIKSNNIYGRNKITNLKLIVGYIRRYTEWINGKHYDIMEFELMTDFKVKSN